MSNFKFATFGCWNNPSTQGRFALKKTIANITEKENKYNFLVILGDNYYANKEKIKYKDSCKDFKIKKTNLKELKEGFDIINDISIEKKLLFGNHDIEDSKDTNCSSLKVQLNIPWYDIKFPFSSDLYYIGNSAFLIIYLDTTLYSIENPEDGLCYILTINNDYQQLKDAQKNFITEKLEKFNKLSEKFNLVTKHVIFCAHEPLFACKPKIAEDGSVKHKKNILNDLIKLIFEVKNIYKNFEFTWICADYHIYQNSIIRDKSDNTTYCNSIKQWIFGTGGGELDEAHNPNTENITEGDYELQIIDSKKQHGYGEIIISDSGEITHNFIETSMTGGAMINSSKHYENKYYKYKNKYLNLKNNF